MANYSESYKEADHILKKIGNFGVYDLPEEKSMEQHKAIQMLITYNILKKNGNHLSKGPAFPEVQQLGVKKYIRAMDQDYTSSLPGMLWNLLTKNPLIIGLIIVLLSAWITMRFMK